MGKKINRIQTREELYLTLPRGGVGAELGVCKGSNAAMLFHYIKPSKMYLVDIWTEKCPDGNEWHPNLIPHYGNHYELINNIFVDEIGAGQVELVRGYTTDFLRGIPDGHLDWVYIDSDHHYDVVSAEIDICLRKVKKGGYIMGHDYFHFLDNTWGNSVIRAVNERIQSGDMTMEMLTEDRWPSYLCRVL